MRQLLLALLLVGLAAFSAFAQAQAACDPTHWTMAPSAYNAAPVNLTAADSFAACTFVAEYLGQNPNTVVCTYTPNGLSLTATPNGSGGSITLSRGCVEEVAASAPTGKILTDSQSLTAIAIGFLFMLAAIGYICGKMGEA